MVAKYKPFINIGPGFMIEEELESRGWSKGDLATITGINSAQISQIIHDKRPITLDTAKLLGKAFGQSTQYWFNLYTNYILRQEESTQAETEAEIKANILTHMPIADMVKKHWIPKWNGNVARLVKAVKDFWGMEKLDFSFMDKQPDLAFRKSDAYEKYNLYYALTWYQMAKKCAAKYKMSHYDPKRLQVLAKSMVDFSCQKSGVALFINELNKVGVKFFILPHLEKTYTDGASFWDGDNPVIVWTARYKREDNFWFTVAHEIAHVLLHLKDKSSYIIDFEQMEQDKKENEANDYAATTIKRNEILQYFAGMRKTGLTIQSCAKQLNISPAIIVGQLQYLNLIKPYQLRNLIDNDITGEIPKEYFGFTHVA
ncbi:MAG TPA: ImmA/IrrE family metallo-endopeptidase [Anaerohalosphaeraceae bacterium]|nr:ImmA/IrrE family metallo-endopeptidase [Anaerohalosphaeraceae bacterium]